MFQVKKTNKFSMERAWYPSFPRNSAFVFHLNDRIAIIGNDIKQTIILNKVCVICH